MQNGDVKIPSDLIALDADNRWALNWAGIWKGNLDAYCYLLGTLWMVITSSQDGEFTAYRDVHVLHEVKREKGALYNKAR